MSAIPGNIDTDSQPPMTIPLRHFILALGLLLAATLLGLASTASLLSAQTELAHTHVLLAGWVGVTIMGAMTQFVPVWSGTTLHSSRLATVQLWLVVVGLAGFGLALVLGATNWLSLTGGVMLLGFWIFVYNIARTLPPVSEFDVTEAHFALALAFFLVATGLGFLLAVDFATPVLADFGLSRMAVLQTHATLAVFGAIVTTIIGALYQLATMFTQTELHGIDTRFQQFEMGGYPIGVGCLAAGRFLEWHLLAAAGGLLVIISLVGIAVILARKLWETQVDWTPMLSRYTVVVGMVLLWAIMTLPAWLQEPLAYENLLAGPGGFSVLALGVIGFVVLGTLYHIIPFIIWVHRYSDLLGYEQVPMIDDLYDERLAAVDFICLLLGTLLLILGSWHTTFELLLLAGGILTLLGAFVFVTNMILVIHSHSPQSLREILGRQSSQTTR